MASASACLLPFSCSLRTHQRREQSHTGTARAVPAAAFFRGQPLDASISATPSLALPRRSLRIEAKGRRSELPAKGVQGGQAQPQFPTIEDDGQPKFVIFTRNRLVPMLWYPLTVVSGGDTAKYMLGLMSSPLGQKLYQANLTRSLAQTIYKEEEQVRRVATRTYPILKSAKAVDYGYKVMDLKNQKASFSTSNIIVIPPKGEMKSIVDRLKAFVASVNPLKGAPPAAKTPQ